MVPKTIKLLGIYGKGKNRSETYRYGRKKITIDFSEFNEKTLKGKIKRRNEILYGKK